MPIDPLYLGLDGGGSGCRARLEDAAGRVLAVATGGAANIRLGIEPAWRAILAATQAALAEAGLGPADLPRLQVGLGLAGITGAEDVERLCRIAPGFADMVIESDAHIACLGAFAGRDGGIAIIGTGSRGYALIGGAAHSVGGWGFALSDQGSGADIGREAVRAAVLAYDGLGPASALTRAVLVRLGGDPPSALIWSETTTPRDYADFAREVVDFAGERDPVAVAILTRAGGQIGELIGRLQALGAGSICLMGGLAPALEPFLPEMSRAALVAPQGDAAQGAILLIRQARPACAAS